VIKNINYLLAINKFEMANVLFDAYRASTTANYRVVAEMRSVFRAYITSNKNN